MERAFAAPALAHGNTRDRGISRVHVKIALTIDSRSAIKSLITRKAQLDASMCFR
jgi:hypothetical protein